MKKALKITGVVLLLAVALAVWAGYRFAKEHGLIPREVYETEPPEIPTMNRTAVLVLDKTNGFVHKDAIPAANAMLRRISEEQGWDIFISNNGAAHDPGVLDNFDLVVWNNVSGDVLTEAQRTSLRQWLENGGGWVGLHGAGGDPKYRWEWYVNTLIGAQFIGHTMDPQFQDADVLVAAPSLPLTAHLPSPWRVAQEEWYAFDRNPRDNGYEILLTIDEDSYITKGNTMFGNDSMAGEHPLAWRHTVGEGRIFYSSIGHQAATYQLENYEQLIANAMAWAMSGTQAPQQ